MKNHQKRKFLFRKGLTVISCICMLCSSFLSHAETAQQEDERRRAIPVETNSVVNWPEGPVVSAQSAILMDVNTHTILYEKNIHEKLYPASITKILTCLIAVEQCESLDETVQVSYEAVHSVPIDGTNVGLDAGQSLSLEDALYAILLKSANEAANAVGEHVSGSISAFVELMNQRAAQLGCVDSHFVTTNGLHDDEHYTSVYDMALIGCSFFQNEFLAKVSGTKYHQIPVTDTQPDLIDMYATNELLPRKTYSYEYLIGSKTGYTSLADSTLVSCAEKDGMKLVCVVMGENKPFHYEDTIALFEYGFSNFSSVTASDYETRYTIDTSDFFQSDVDVFGNSKQFISLDTTDKIIVPSTLTFSSLDTELVYDSEDNQVIATICYSYQNRKLGTCKVLLHAETKQEIIFDTLILKEQSDNHATATGERKAVFVNIMPIIFIIGGIVVFTIAFFITKGLLRNFHFSSSFRDRIKARRRRKPVRQSKSVRRRRHQKRPQTKAKNKSFSFALLKRRFLPTRYDRYDTRHNVSKETRNRLRSPHKKRHSHRDIQVSIHLSDNTLDD